jgi:hypothetical protein
MEISRGGLKATLLLSVVHTYLFQYVTQLETFCQIGNNVLRLAIGDGWLGIKII